MAEELSPSLPPLTPPLTEEEKLLWLRLLRSRRVGVTTFFRLMDEHGSASDALDALPEVARNAGVADYAPCPPETAEREMAAGHRAGAHLLAFGEDSYPKRLMEISDPPPLLWAFGDAGLAARPTVALVGARNASSLGTRMARKMAQALGAADVATVSGLARGIDAAIHAASLETGTIAVVAGGVDVVYPPENAVLAQEISEKGLILSEQAMHLRPQARHFPARNRLVSGLAQAVVVVEAAAKSGSLITAQAALDQGRDVLAVPGHPFDARAAGCNMLIRDGATLVRGARDVTEALLALQDIATQHKETAETEPGTQGPQNADPARDLADTAALHRQILDKLGPSPVAEDQLIRDLAMSAGAVTPAIVSLELDGKIHRASGGMLSRIG